MNQPTTIAVELRGVVITCKPADPQQPLRASLLHAADVTLYANIHHTDIHATAEGYQIFYNFDIDCPFVRRKPAPCSPFTNMQAAILLAQERMS